MNFEKNKLIILAGGKGTRIKKYNKFLPKPLIKFNNIALLSHLIRQLSIFRFKEIIILASYKSNQIIKKYDKKIFNFNKIKVLIEKKPLGTWGSINLHKKKINNDFFLINGDSYLNNINFSFHKLKDLKNNIINMMLTNNHQYYENKKLNNLYINKEKKIIIKKKSNYINSGIYFISKKIFNNTNLKNYSSLENDIIPFFINKKKVNGIINTNKLIDIGTPKSLRKAKIEIPFLLRRPAVFLDRDGVINYDYGYVHKIENFKFKKGVLKTLQYLTKLNYYIFIVTNQAGIAKGIFTEKDFLKLHLNLKSFFLKKKIFIHDVKYCPFHKDAKIKEYKKNTNFRKPGNLMIKEIFKDWIINKKKSFMIGDKSTDEIAAKKSGLYYEYSGNNLFKQVEKIVKKKFNNY